MKIWKETWAFWFMAFLVAHPITLVSAETKIATIDLSRAFDEFEKTKISDDVLKKEGDRKKVERDKKVEEIKKLKGEFDLLNEKGREEKQTMIDQKVRELQEFDREVRDKLRGERDQMVRDILREIDEVIQDYGRKNDYTIILNDRVLLYREKTMDVTDEIIGSLNKKKGKKR